MRIGIVVTPLKNELFRVGVVRSKDGAMEYGNSKYTK